MAQIVKKYAPKVSMVDADASKLDEINEVIKSLNASKGGSISNKESIETDPIEELRKYKKLLDD